MTWNRSLVLAILLACIAFFPMSAAESGALVPSPAPDEFLVRNWQSDDGLPHDTVSSIVQTRDGFLRVATDRGLARFDGLTFTVFSGYSQKELSPMSKVSRLFEAGDGALLIVGNRGGTRCLPPGQVRIA
jgi:ligand-binding sensor domain-containing protein